MSSISFHQPRNGKNIVEQVLEQGQRLRNAMVQSILNNDPFSSDLMSSKSSSTIGKDTYTRRNIVDKDSINRKLSKINVFETDSTEINVTEENSVKRNSTGKKIPEGITERKATEKIISSEEKEQFAAYLRGDKMSKAEERQALESFRNMSNSDITEFADKTVCTCSTCKTYYSKKFSDDEAVPPLHLETGRSNRNRFTSKESADQTTADSVGSPVAHYLKYVDSLKISVHSLSLNQDGIKKVYGSTVDKKYQLPPSYSHSYFIDYTIPDNILKMEPKSKAKVDSGLNINKHVRMCSKKVYNKAIYFKQISFHDIQHLDQVDLRNIDVKFQVTSRTSKQKSSNVLGIAKFNMGSFDTTKYLTCNQEILLMLDNEAPIALGTLKVSLQLGCGRLYFGREFTDAIASNKENTRLLPENIYDSDERIDVPTTTSRSGFNSESSVQTVIAQEPQNGSSIPQTGSSVLQTGSSIPPAGSSIPPTGSSIPPTISNIPPTIPNILISNIPGTNIPSSNISSTFPPRLTPSGLIRKETKDQGSIFQNKDKIEYTLAPQQLPFVGPQKPCYNLDQQKSVGFSRSQTTRPEESLHWRTEYVGPENRRFDNIQKNKPPDLSRHTYSQDRSRLDNAPSSTVSGNMSSGNRFLDQRDNTNLHGKHISHEENQILFGFIYVSEAHYLEKCNNTYFTCSPFSLDDIFYSRLVYCSATPVYNFKEIVPFLYDDAFLNRLRDNCMVFEFWEKCEDSDSLIGICKIPLHQFYVAYRNPVIVKYLLTNELPIICTDWWEPICDPITGRIYGQAQILIALGSEEQIRNLQGKRGFKDDVVKAKSTNFVNSKSPSTKSTRFIDSEESENSKVKEKTVTFGKKISSTSSFRGGTDTSSFRSGAPFKSSVQTYDKYNRPSSRPRSPVRNIINKLVSPRKKVDKSVQSDLVMEPSDNDNNPPSKDMLTAFLAQLIEKQKNVCVENGTNTDNTIADSSRISNRDNSSSHSENAKASDEASNNTVLGDNATISSKASNANLTTAEVDLIQNTNIRKTSDLLDSLEKALSEDTKSYQASLEQASVDPKPKTSFKAHIVIEGAMHLPSRKKCKSKKSKSRNSKPEEILPSTYVTFETMPESDLKVTPIVPKCTNPTWDYRCDVLLPIDLLINNQKRLIFKVWRKCNGNSVVPNMQADLVLGFAALDLTVLKAGLPTVQGWFNIVDFSSKCNGQIKINITPLENVTKVNTDNSGCGTHITSLFNNEVHFNETDNKTDEPSELLSRALKRKFIELDEITQRLRLRLSTVTNDESDVSNDEIADEFERDINTLCVEDDYDMINFESMEKSKQTNSGGLLGLGQGSSDNQKSALLQFIESRSNKQNGDSTPTDTTTKMTSVVNPSGQNAFGKENDLSSNLGTLTIDVNDIPVNPRSVNPHNVNSLDVNSRTVNSYSVNSNSVNSHSIDSHNLPSQSANDTLSEISNASSSDINNEPTLIKTADVSKEIGILDQQLSEGKQRIASLLEKLSLITQADCETFSNRYVSGCSVSTQDAAQSDDILKELGIDGGLNLDADCIINPLLFQELCGGSLLSTPQLLTQRTDVSGMNTQDTNTTSSSSSSVCLIGGQFSRDAPDGAGNCTEDNDNSAKST